MADSTATKKARQYRLLHRDRLQEYDRQYYLSHKKEVAERGRRYYLAHWAEAKEYSHLYYQALKTKILTYYGGGKCACVKCGYNNVHALSIDHIKGDGAKHRRLIGDASGRAFYSWLKRNGYPEGYQTLCMNCQWVKRYENGEFFSIY